MRTGAPSVRGRSDTSVLRRRRAARRRQPLPTSSRRLPTRRQPPLGGREAPRWAATAFAAAARGGAVGSRRDGQRLPMPRAGCVAHRRRDPKETHMTTPALLTIVAQPPGTRRTRPVPAALHDVTVHPPHRSLLLERLSLDVRRGEVTSVLSRHDVTAGTILDLLAGRAQPSGGSVRVLGREVTRLAPDALRRLRREHIGRVFPTYGAQPRLTVAQNLHVARRRSGLAADHAWVDRVAAALDLHGMLGFRAGEGIDDRRLRWTVARSL